jgi:LuxR family maltose regulon positive regulatory protein
MRPHRDVIDIEELERPASARGIEVLPGGQLLRSKLAVPPVPSMLLARPRLHTLLHNSAAAVTVVSAPAGWGKTVLLSSWVQTLADGLPVAWLSLEPGDDASRLWSCIQVSLGLPEPDAWGEPPAGGSVSLIAETLVGLAQPTVLILDEFQHLHDAASRSAVEFLVRHAGGRLRLIITTRVDPPLPLVRWRLAGDLLDIGTKDLAFTEAEIVELLARHGHTLPDQMVAELAAYTEGWPAILGLAALAMSGSPCTTSVDRVLAAAAPSIQDYLRREVLLDQPTGLRDVLLRTSILDRLSRGLVQAVTDRRDVDRVLAELERRNLFAAPPGTQPPSYSYHRVLGEMMRRELGQTAADSIPDLHRRAAAWHESVGLVGEALHHALAGGHFRQAAKLVTDEWHHFVLCPHATPTRTRGVSLPDGAIPVDPELDLACAAAHIEAGDAVGAARHLRLADHHRDMVADDRRDGFVAACVALGLARARLSGDADGVSSGAQRLLALARDDQLGPASRDEVTAMTTTALGMAQLGRGDLREAEETLADACVACDRLGLSCARAMCASGLAFIQALRGELRSSQRLAQTALAVPPCSGRSGRLHCGFALLALAILDIEWNRLDDAETNLQLAADSCGPLPDPVLSAVISIVRAQMLHERGDPVGAHETLLTGRRYVAARPSPFLRDWYLAVEAGVRTAHGDPDTVRQSFEPALESADAAPAALAVVLARAYLADDDCESASRLVPRWPEDRDGIPRALRLEAGLIEAVATHRRGDERGAARMLERVLEAAEPDGFRRVFVRAGAAVRDLLLGHLESGTAYWATVRDLVDAIDDRTVRETAAPGLAEALTDREVTVLRYLQSVLSNAEIASDMSLSVNTVKTHVRNIYRKLDTTRRRDAVQRARQLHLI